MATYLVGDIQGCFDPLQRLLDKISFDPASDLLWSCGDLVNRGGKSLEVLRLLHGLGNSFNATLGNHDLYLLYEHSRFPGGGSHNREFDQVLRDPQADVLMDWLASQPLAAWSAKHNLLRVHAGVLPDWTRQQVISRAAEVSTALRSEKRPLLLRKLHGKGPRAWDEQLKGWKRLRFITNVLTRARFCDAAGHMDLQTAGPPGSQQAPYRPWFKHPHRQTRDVRIAFGHWAALGFKAKKRYLALDSGCVWGGKLTAYRLEDDQVFQVGLKS